VTIAAPRQKPPNGCGFRPRPKSISEPARAKVTQLILSQTTRPVIYGLLAGVGLAGSLATILIATPAAAPLAEIVRVTDPIAYAASVLSIVVACLLAAWIPAARAARLEPMRTLRQE
jgi:hypothetical protein